MSAGDTGPIETRSRDGRKSLVVPVERTKHGVWNGSPHQVIRLDGADFTPRIFTESVDMAEELHGAVSWSGGVRGYLVPALQRIGCAAREVERHQLSEHDLLLTSRGSFRIERSRHLWLLFLNREGAR